jgi:hypothetical protein
MLAETTVVRLRTQLDVVPLILAGAASAAADWRPAPGKWSAREQLAHVARMHEVMRERLDRILAEPEPRLARYRAEEDAEWPSWAALPLAEVTARLPALRAGLVEAVAAIPPAGLERRGTHGAFGAMTIPLWLEFFLLHEGHHLYSAMQLVRTASAATA